jgi:phage/conjugal plasmid C-4 type zinc finger TraR family protein
MSADDAAVDAWERLDEIVLKSRRRVPRRADGGIHCLACGEDIPAARRFAAEGCGHCIDCQKEIDRRRQ